MRDVFAETIKDERVTIADGSFDNTHVDNGWADLVVIAQARSHLSSDSNYILNTNILLAGIPLVPGL